MLNFHVPDISCQHCVASITESIHKMDAQAQVQIDTESKKVQVQTHKLDAEAVALAIAEAGYTVQVD